MIQGAQQTERMVECFCCITPDQHCSECSGQCHRKWQELPATQADAEKYERQEWQICNGPSSGLSSTLSGSVALWVIYHRSFILLILPSQRRPYIHCKVMAMKEISCNSREVGRGFFRFKNVAAAHSFWRAWSIFSFCNNEKKNNNFMFWQMINEDAENYVYLGDPRCSSKDRS